MRPAITVCRVSGRLGSECLCGRACIRADRMLHHEGVVDFDFQCCQCERRKRLCNLCSETTDSGA